MTRLKKVIQESQRIVGLFVGEIEVYDHSVSYCEVYETYEIDFFDEHLNVIKRIDSTYLDVLKQLKEFMYFWCDSLLKKG